MRTAKRQLRTANSEQRTANCELNHPVSEDEIVHLLRSQFGKKIPSLLKGIGDDAAVVHPDGAREDWVVTTDVLEEGVDFQIGWTRPELLGHKTAAANLSDIAAMGVRPRFYVVALSIPSNISGRWIRAFYSGLTALCDAFGASLIGGDLSRSPGGIHISMTVLGESLNRRVTYRSGGKPGDLIYATGSLGGASAGLRLLQRGCHQGRTAAQREALSAQRTPLPRCCEGLWLSQSGFVRCMMDISDGLSMDLPRMCEESGTGAEIFLSQIPVFKGSASLGFEPIELALHGGEDFELLFCVPRRSATAFSASYPADLAPATCIGRLTAGCSIFYANKPGTKKRPLPAIGFDHFRKI